MRPLSIPQLVRLNNPRLALIQQGNKSKNQKMKLFVTTILPLFPLQRVFIVTAPKRSSLGPVNTIVAILRATDQARTYSSAESIHLNLKLTD
jgi:hypothetical protein